MTVSAVQLVSLSIGDSVDVVAGPCVLTDLIVTELTGGSPAAVAVVGGANGMAFMSISVAAGQSWVWHGALALGRGVTVVSEMGEVAVTVGYR